jgi:hypothetical protein
MKILKEALMFSTILFVGATGSAADESTLTPPLVTARGMSLGNNLVPIVNDASATLWNPARLVGNHKWSVIGDWSRFSAGLDGRFYAVSYSDGLNGYGVSHRNVGLAELVGFRFDERVTTVAYARRFGALRLGLAFNAVDIGTAFGDAGGRFWTAGADYEAPGGWNVSLRGYELGYFLKFDGAPSERARSTWDLGVAKRFNYQETPFTLAVTFADIGEAAFREMLSLGLEAEVSPSFRARLGMQGGRLTGGFGIVTERGFSLEVGFSDRMSLGQTVAFSASYRF